MFKKGWGFIEKKYDELINDTKKIQKVIIALSIVIAFILLFSFLINVAPLFFSWSRLPQKPFEQLPSLILGTATLIAILTYDRERGKFELETKRTRSEFFYRQASRGLDEVFDLLRDQNNDRVTWVRAARSLLQAIELSEEIELPEYKRAYRLHAERVRNDLYLALTVRDPESGNRKSLPPQFFYGIPDWDSGKSLDEVAKETSSPIRAYTASIDEILPEPSLYPLSRKSVCAIFNFLQFPTDYQDPLNEIEIWGVDWIGSFGARQGATRYIAHRNETYVIDGKLYRRDSPNPSEG